MKIAIFTDTFAPDINGVARTLKRFTDYLRDHRIEYRVFAPESSKKVYSDNIYRFKSLKLFFYPDCKLAFPKMPQVKAELQRFQPDIIHVATPFNMGLCGLYYAKKLNIPIVGSYHTDFDKYLAFYDLQFLKKFLWKYMHWFHRPLRKIFVPSLDTKESLQKHGFTNLSIWTHGVDHSIFRPDVNFQAVRQKYNIQTKHILLYVGRIAPEKDVRLLPEIAEMLPEEVRNDVHWLVVGDGPIKQELEDKAPANMTFTGFLTGDDLVQAYAASDLFIFPSTTETFGNVVLESLACGTPVVAANAGGVRTIIQHGVTGLLCEEKDVKGFADSITQLIKNKDQRLQLAENGKNYALTQTWDAIFENLLYEYEEAIKPNTQVNPA